MADRPNRLPDYSITRLPNSPNISVPVAAVIATFTHSLRAHPGAILTFK
jgi:hypothetical protein